MVLEMINNEINIRQMTEEDLDAVKRLELNCGLSFWSVEEYHTSLRNSDYIMLIAQYYNNIIGFSVARLITQKGGFTSFEVCEKNIEIEIYNIGIDAKYRRRGIGREMIEKCLISLNSSARVIFYLDVRKSNTEAINFYLNLGFSIKGVRKQFYRNPSEDSLVMSLDKNYKP